MIDPSSTFAAIVDEINFGGSQVIVNGQTFTELVGHQYAIPYSEIKQPTFECPPQVFEGWNETYIPSLMLGLNQVITELLREDTSRRAVFPITAPRSCLTSIQFLVRSDTLELVATFRSQEAELCLPWDAYHLSQVRLQLLEQLRQHEQFTNLQVGVIICHVGSLHVESIDERASKPEL